MPEDSIDSRIVAAIRANVREAARELLAAGARDEAMAEYIPSRTRAKIFRREAVMVPVGRAWRLGVVLVDRDANLYATGHITRIGTLRDRPIYHSASAEERRQLRAAAERGHFETDETVNFGWSRIELDPAALRAGTGPLVLADDEVRVRWSVSAGAVDFARYLADRVNLLTRPPAGT